MMCGKEDTCRNASRTYLDITTLDTGDPMYMHNGSELPYDMTFNEPALMSVIVYCILFVVAAVGNLTVFVTLCRSRRRRSRFNRFILHLSIADLIVTFVMLPLEVIWNVTVAWKAGDVACRVLMFFRAFGFYLSSLILVTISIDRYFAILHPLRLNDAETRGKLMLLFSWLFSFVASVPQVSYLITRLYGLPFSLSPLEMCVVSDFVRSYVWRVSTLPLCLIIYLHVQMFAMTA